MQVGPQLISVTGGTRRGLDVEVTVPVPVLPVLLTVNLKVLMNVAVTVVSAVILTEQLPLTKVQFVDHEENR